jgi:hypothetical protein
MFAAWSLLFGGASAGQEVVANKTAGVTQLDLHALRAIFGMRLAGWPNGTRIIGYVMDPDSHLHTRFVKRNLQLFPYQLTQAWDRLVFSGTGQAPLQVRSPSDMHQRVLTTPGAIGYLPEEINSDDLIKVEIVE